MKTKQLLEVLCFILIMVCACIGLPAAAFGYAFPGSCAVYDFSTETLHLPCLDYNGENIWVDLHLSSWEPIELDLQGFGSDVSSNPQCSTFDAMSNTVFIPCVDYGGSNLRVTLGVASWDPIRVAVTSYAENAPDDNFHIGDPVLTDIWVDPAGGDDGNSGSGPGQALRTIREAWGRIPAGVVLSGTGYRILLAAGDYPASDIPGWMESRYGTYAFPVIIQSASGPNTARLHGYFDLFDVRYLYLIDLDFVTDPGYGGGGNVVHIAGADHLLIRGSRLSGYDGSVRQPQETLKINQSKYIYVERSDISGAFWFALDFVSVDYGHIRQSRIHDASEDCLVLKGGSSNFVVEGNEIDHCNSIGFSAGEGTGFEFMTSPRLHYEASDIKFTNNILHDVQNAGIAVRGGYNILAAFNTLYRVGYDPRGSGLLLLSPGSRSCDGDTPACQARNSAGGWGPATAGDGGEWIPTRNVFIYNNIFYNPLPLQTLDSHFVVFGPTDPPAGSNIPSPALSDDNLEIRGNIIWNGSGDRSLGLGESGQGCQPGNSTCNPSQITSDNSINIFEPVLAAPDSGNFRPLSGGTVLSSQSLRIPIFFGNDRPEPPLAPLGDVNNGVPRDRDGCRRTDTAPPGAFITATGTCP
ncbi:MAG: right-handed parallel beta-helix repeat-containing protein [Nitrospirae bacterium]|nr:MAG: right-handed parallel beta-helix repeat-containing protein [Nitrospirota bacterium]